MKPVNEKLRVIINRVDNAMDGSIRTEVWFHVVYYLSVEIEYMTASNVIFSELKHEISK